MVIGMEIYSEIRKAYLSGESQRSIANRLGISRQTVKKYCEGETVPGERKEYLREPTVVTDEVKSFILECLEYDQASGLKKQKHTAKRIYDRLVDELGFTGSYSIVRLAVRELRADLIPAQADVPLEYDPGDAIQIDWGEVQIYLNDVRITANIFCGRLCYSCDIFVMVCFSQNMESFLEAQQRMFEYFGGVPRRLIFDNAKVAVKEGFGLHAHPQKDYKDFAAHYVFGTDFCNPASGNEKGLVENLVGYARRNFFVPVPKASSMAELNEDLIRKCLNYRAKHKVSSRSASVKVLYEQELAYLHKIAPYKYDTARIATPSVGDFSTVRFDRNSYSVPVTFLRKTVTVKGYANSVSIICDDRTVVTYERLQGQGKTAYKLEHYLDLLERKPRSVFQAKPVRRNVRQELLDWGMKLPGGNKEMVRLLRLCIDYGEDIILDILNSMPHGVTPTVDLVRSYLVNGQHHLPEDRFSNEIPVNKIDLTYYDRKCGVAAV